MIQPRQGRPCRGFFMLADLGLFFIFFIDTI
jgi:hypothetical protein